MKFNYMGPNNEILTSVSVNKLTKKVTFKNYTNDPMDCVFGIQKTATYDDLVKFFEGRCISKERSDIKDILDLLGLKKYDPYQICKKSKGTSAQDENWIDFLED